MNTRRDNAYEMRLKQKNYGHNPVHINTVEKLCELKEGDTVVDCTLGLGGHSELFLKKVGEKGKLIAFELDEKNLKIAKDRLKKNKNQIIFIHENFALLQNEIEKRKISGIKLVFFDLGLASTQVDDPQRGFAFLKDGPLDMRFDKRSALTAEKIINQYSQRRLEQIFREYGEERYSKKFARIIKDNIPIKTTLELADLIEANTPKQQKRRRKKIHPATKIFQALRIEVNNELELLRDALTQALNVLEKGGKLMVISYHSLEDRIVKRFMREAAKDCICPPEIPVCVCEHEPELKIITKKPVSPDEEEIEENPRARSAKLRVAEKIK